MGARRSRILPPKTVMLVKGRPRYRCLGHLLSLSFASALLGVCGLRLRFILFVENKIRSEGSSESEECAGLPKHLVKFSVHDREENARK